MENRYQISLWRPQKAEEGKRATLLSGDGGDGEEGNKCCSRWTDPAVQQLIHLSSLMDDEEVAAVQTSKFNEGFIQFRVSCLQEAVRIYVSACEQLSKRQGKSHAPSLTLTTLFRNVGKSEFRVTFHHKFCSKLNECDSPGLFKSFSVR